MLRRLLFLALLGLLAIFGGRLILLGAAHGAPAADEVPPVADDQHRAALVLGAGLNRNGTPSAVLRDRIREGVALLKAGKADLLLMSGDNSVDRYSEPTAMRKAALALGVPDEQIAVDYGGRRTWDSCVRAHEVFGVRHVIVVTNDFHRARSVVLCRAAGLTVDGAAGTKTTSYAGYKGWIARETIASWRGVADAWIHHPKVAVGGEPIDPYDRCDVWASLSDTDRDTVATSAPDC
ncbi:MAG: YdcF family protein [Solirubrobacteraceae bacterium]|nr:YdcF family protein [Solirubrobacteraceae bacterium]